MGCLYVDGSLFDRHAHDGSDFVSDIPGVEVHPFHCANIRVLLDRLQSALHDLRREWGSAAAIAVGTGCAAALALACQLPVEKLVLIDPSAPARLLWGRRNGDPDDGQRVRALRRMAAFARRNLPLCVSDMLIVSLSAESGEDALRRAYGIPVNCRVNRLDVRGKSDKDLYTIREIAVKAAISRFLNPLESSKPLAENPEMCIIYG